MLRITELRLPLDHAAPALRAAVLRRLGLQEAALQGFTVFRRAWDARKKSAIVLSYTVDCELAAGVDEAACWPATPATRTSAPRPTRATAWSATRRRTSAAAGRPRPVVVGFGPCGIFAALILAQMGLRPIVLERGKPVRERTKDTWGLWRQGVLDPESNVQFGEGGAGTFSDGKLWSQISDPRHLTRKVLTEFVQGRCARRDPVRGQAAHRHLPPGEHGREDACRDRSPGRRDPLPSSRWSTCTSRRAPAVRGCAGRGEQLRRRPCRAGAGPQRARHLCDAAAAGCVHGGQAVFGGLSHRAPASVIDRARFGPNAGHPILGAADYKLVHHAGNGRSVYSFCMCPGGTVVAATSEPGAWSPTA
jgi:uncharacterized FAD-dependent dehydrogenase